MIEAITIKNIASYDAAGVQISDLKKINYIYGIAEAVDEIVLEVPGLQITGIGEKILGQITMHLERTEEIYNNIVGSE